MVPKALLHQKSFQCAGITLTQFNTFFGGDANTFFDAIKPIPKIGRRYAMSPVTEYIARRALSLRETTDLTWADIAEKIVVELREKEHPTEVERNVIKRLSDAISTNDRKFIGTVVSQTIVALKKHSLP